MTRYPFLIFVFALVCLASPARADNTFLNYLFPSIFGKPDQGPRPQDTLIAPFAQDAQKPRVLSDTERQTLTSPENSVPVTHPHRSDKYILDWASERTGAAFIYDPEKMKMALGKSGTDLKKILPAQVGPFLAGHHLEGLKPYYMPEALKAVQTYLDTAGMTTAMNAQQQIQAFIKTTPRMMNEGVFGETYRWLIDVPVTLSILPAGMDNYMGKNREKTPTTESIVIRLQITRTPASGGYVDGMAIETFTVMGSSS